jgi:hypothetical protein
MARIVDIHFPGLKRELLREALTLFFRFRETTGLRKKSPRPRNCSSGSSC